MSWIAQLLPRPELTAEQHVLVVAKVSLGPADWMELEACIQTARDLGLERAGLEETLLQGVLFFGFPRVVAAFEVLERCWPVDTPPCGGALRQEEQSRAGERLFETIYGKNASTVRAKLRSFHADFEESILGFAYARVMTRPRLSPLWRELLAVGALAILDQMPQLEAHARGARTFGATRSELCESIYSAIRDQRAADAIASMIPGKR